MYRNSSASALLVLLLLLGIGAVVMLYTAIMLISNIEGTFNDIWKVGKTRSWSHAIIK